MGINSPHYMGVNCPSNGAVTTKAQPSWILLCCWNVELAGSHL